MLVEDMVKSLVESTMQIKQTKKLFQQTITTHMKSLTSQISQLADAVSRLNPQYGKLLSQPKTNVRNVSAISTVSCLESSPDVDTRSSNWAC